MDRQRESKIEIQRERKTDRKSESHRQKDTKLERG